jgi:deoxyribodipyrimidine photo-lyase
MGKWLYFNLIDGDLASNFLSWQWVAGTSISKRYTVNQKLINGCSNHKQVRSILTYDRDEMCELATPAVLQPYFDEALTTIYPVVEPVVTVAGARVQLYTPWTLDPTWRKGESDRRILVIDPMWFDRYPVSEQVLDFITRQGSIVIPDLEVHIGSVGEIHGIDDALSVTALRHQTNQDWLVEFDTVEKIFPNVSGYYKSFFAYWKTVEKSYGI